MKTTGIVTDPRFRQHLTGDRHPERPERLEVLEELLSTAPYRDLPRVATRAASEEEIARVHEPSMMSEVAASAGRPSTRFDADTSASAGSFEAASLAAGGAIELVDAILSGDLDNGFAALRPPGHHAERDRAMGFCLFNNVAVVARHLREARGIERVLVLDWDVHHGNGTQHSFWADPSVMYCSLHQYPFYPGTGAPDEVGGGEAAGYTVNLPMQAGWGGEEYAAAYREVVLPVARRFDPGFVLVSAGFDAHRDDPLAMMRLQDADYAQMAAAMISLADECCDGRIAMLLEGGYDLDALRSSVQVVLDSMCDPPAFDDNAGAELSSWGRATQDALRPYWKF